MKKCKFDDSIDDYLLSKLNEEDREEFEEHYFNCQQCFEKMVARDELIAVVKNRGHVIFEEEAASEEKEMFSLGKVFSFLTPTQWALATASVAMFLVIFLSVIPLFKKTPPQFTLDQAEIVRGESITLVSPVENIRTAPSLFSWKKLAEDVEYRISLYSEDEPIWTASTKENVVSVPTGIKNLLEPGQEYSWEVKAFSPQGAVMATSGKVQFRITSTK